MALMGLSICDLDVHGVVQVLIGYKKGVDLTAELEEALQRRHRSQSNKEIKQQIYRLRKVQA